VTQHARLALGGVEQTGQHLERGGFARAVGAEEAHHLARRDLERNMVAHVGLQVE
jgi:hypothetical protein